VQLHIFGNYEMELGIVFPVLQKQKKTATSFQRRKLLQSQEGIITRLLQFCIVKQEAPVLLSTPIHQADGSHKGKEHWITTTNALFF